MKCRKSTLALESLEGRRLLTVATGFAEHNVAAQQTFLRGVWDVDSDGDDDLVAFRDGETVWFENLDHGMRFSDGERILNSVASRVLAADIDGDGDSG